MATVSQQLATKVIATLFVIAIITHWRIALVFFSPALSEFYLFLAIIAFAFFVLNISTAIGLYRYKIWGFIVAYVTIVVNTIFLSICYIPIVAELFSLATRMYAVIISNLVILGILIYLHIQLTKRYTHYGSHKKK